MEERRIRAMREMKMQEVNAYIEWEREKMRMKRARKEPHKLFKFTN